MLPYLGSFPKFQLPRAEIEPMDTVMNQWAWEITILASSEDRSIHMFKQTSLNASLNHRPPVPEAQMDLVSTLSTGQHVSHAWQGGREGEQILVLKKFGNRLRLSKFLGQPAQRFVVDQQVTFQDMVMDHL